MGFGLPSLLAAIVVVAIGASYMALRDRRGGRTSSGRERTRSVGRAVRPDLVGGPELAKAIGSLPEGFSLAWSVPTPAGEVPAVVLGPTGLWAIAGTKSRGHVGVIDGTVTVGGRRTELASEIWRRGHTLAELLATNLETDIPPIQAALVFLEPGTLPGRGEAMGVRLLSVEQTNGALTGSRVRLAARAIDDLREALAHLANVPL